MHISSCTFVYKKLQLISLLVSLLGGVRTVGTDARISGRCIDDYAGYYLHVERAAFLSLAFTKKSLYPFIAPSLHLQ